jgi:hypothetical protein
MDKKLSKMAVPLTVPVGVPSSNGVHLRLLKEFHGVSLYS